MSASLDNTEQQAASSGGSGGASGVLALSLFLLLLAFFILLVAISKFETEKIDQVLFSLDEAFEVPKELLLAEQAVTSREGRLNPQQEFFEVIDKVFRDELQFTKVRVVNEGDKMVIAVPIDGVFDPNSSEIRVEAAGLIGRLAESLNRDVPDGRYNLDMIVPLGAAAADRELAIRRAGRFARALAAHGAPSSAMSIGARQRLRNEVHFFFAIVEDGSDGFNPFAPELSEAEDGGGNAQ